MPNAKPSRFAKWWRGWGGAFALAIGLVAVLYVCGATGLIDAIGDFIDGARDATR